MANGKREGFLSRMAASSWRVRLIVATLTMVLSFELVAGQKSQLCNETPVSGGLVQAFDSAKQRALESYQALRLAYQLQRRASDLEKQEVSAERRKAGAPHKADSLQVSHDI